MPKLPTMGLGLWGKGISKIALPSQNLQRGWFEPRAS